MKPGLKRGVVILKPHDPEWEMYAKSMIEKLRDIFGNYAIDIQHVGSTAIRTISAKPVIDIAIAVNDLSDVDTLMPKLNKSDLYKSGHLNEGEIMICDGNQDSDTRSYHIHIVKDKSTEWNNYIKFRDYLNCFPDKAKEYEQVKISLRNKYPFDRKAYTEGKEDIITRILDIAHAWAILRNNPDLGIFTEIEPVYKGWSDDKKYRITDEEGITYMMRISPLFRYESRKALFTMMQKVAALGVPMCKPVSFGKHDDTYMLLSWIEGEDLESIMSELPDSKQYELGIESGEILRLIHSLKSYETDKHIEDWETRFNRKTDVKIEKYKECGIRFNGDEHILSYLEQNRHLLKTRPQCFQHGDYHVGNMMLEKGQLKIIDFDRYDFGDPWEEFNRIVWSAAASPLFATAQLYGYFQGPPPEEFWKLLAFYIASNTLSSIYWALPFGKSDLDVMMKQSQDVLYWFNNMKNPVPVWFMQDDLLNIYYDKTDMNS